MKNKKSQIRNLVILLFLLVVMWVTAFTFAPESEVLEDPMLENAIRLELGLSPEAPLQPAQLETVTSLSVREAGVKRLNGISLMPNLVELDLRDNDIENVSPLRRLEKLKVLDLRENQIRDLNGLEHLTQLEELNLRENRISDISDLAPLTSMRELNIRENQINDISALSNMNVLRDLNMRHNQISSIEPLANLENLVQRLYLEGNPIQDTSVIDHYYDNILETDF